ncbi:hypothetical protein GCM10028807_62470 [Spirosoma daeguense]
MFGVDAPLDYERLYREYVHAVERQYNPDAVDEGNLVIGYLKRHLKATPQQNQKVYQQVSHRFVIQLLKAAMLVGSITRGYAYTLNPILVGGLVNVEKIIMI